MNGNNIAFKTIFSFLMLAGFTNAPIFTKNKQTTAQNTNKAEYEKLLAQCRAIRDEMVRLTVEEIKIMQQKATQEHQESCASFSDRYCALGGRQAEENTTLALNARQGQLAQRLAAISADACAQLPIRIAICLTTYLKRIGTPVALQLLNDLIRVGFIF